MKRLIVFLACLSFAASGPAWATDYYVNGNVTASGTGLSWGQAFKTINEATAASSPTNIFVAGGELPIVYTESTTVTIPDAVRLLGGFPPTGNPTMNDRDPARYVTIIDGQSTHNEVVTIADNATNFTLVDGFTISSGLHHGIKNGDNSRCLFRALTLIANGSAPGVSNGAGLHCGAGGSFPDIEDCHFANNIAGSGGAIYCPGDSTFRATKCRFVNNTASGSGGAVYVAPAPIPQFVEIPPKALPAASAGNFTRNQVRSCDFIQNFATGDGGAISFYEELYAIACRFTQNQGDNGGAIECTYGSLLGLNLEFDANHAGADGGAIHVSRGCFLTLVNSLAHHNTAGHQGGVLYGLAVARAHLVNVTLAENSALDYDSFSIQFTTSGCGVGGSPFLSIRNSIIWDSATDAWPSSMDSFIDSDYNHIRSGAIGAHDLDLTLHPDPVFVNSANNYRLKDCSPCIDSADTRRVAEDKADADSDARTICGGCDSDDAGEFTPDLDFRRRVRDLAAASDVGEPADLDACPQECEKIVDMGAYEFACGECLVMGDMNQDGLVNGRDIQIFTDCAVHLSEGEPETCACGDFNADGRVDIEDVPCFIELLLTGDTSCPGLDCSCEDPPPFTLKDCNGNEVPDANDIAFGASLDCNRNGIPDECDLNPEDPDGNELVSEDVNSNDIPDECETDCDNDTIPDAWAVAEELVADINANGIPDPCEPDCDGNEQPDDYDIAHGADDCNSNGVPDSCEDDCNSNGVPDDCDIDPLDPDGDESVSEDCNQNGIPDTCDLSRSLLPSFDCNDNQVPDECDIASEASEDANENGIPDECEEESLWGGGESMMSGEGGGEFDADAAWEAFFEWYNEQVFGNPGDWHTLSGPQRFERVMDELALLGLPIAAPW